MLRIELGRLDKSDVDDTHRVEGFQKVFRLLQINLGLQVAQGQSGGIEGSDAAKRHHRFGLVMPDDTVEQPTPLAFAVGDVFPFVQQPPDAQDGVVVEVGATVVEHFGDKIEHER